MTVWEFEQAVWQREGIRIVIRAPHNAAVGDYRYERAAAERMRLSQLLENRIWELVGDHEVAVIRGDGEHPPGHIGLRRLRASYLE